MNGLRGLFRFTIPVSLLLLVSACSSECSPTVADGWVRMPPMPMPMAGGFATIENHCDRPLVIVGVRSPVFADVSLHQTTLVDGISRMRPLPELTIAAGQSATLAPGSMHLMLLEPSQPLQAGGKVAVDFVLKDGSILSADLEIRASAN